MLGRQATAQCSEAAQKTYLRQGYTTYHSLDAFPAKPRRCEVRQALLEELQHCATVLFGFLALKQPQGEAECSAPQWQIVFSTCNSSHRRHGFSLFKHNEAEDKLVELLRGLGLCKPRPRVEAFASVAAQIQLIQALFATVDRQGGKGSELLLWSVDQIRAGQLVLQGYRADFYCWYTYKGAGVERTVPVSSTQLAEYCTRSLMSLEGLHEQRDKFDLLQEFLEKVRAIVANDTGLAATATQLCKVGHPRFRQDVEIPMQSNLAVEAHMQLEALGTWRQEVYHTLDGAPLLGLVPQGQMHAWLAQAYTEGLTEEMLQSMAEGLSAWSHCSSEGFESKLRMLGIWLGQPLEASAALAALRVCCEDLVVEPGPGTAPGLGRVQVPAKDSEDALKKVAHLFLASEGGPKRLPRPSEVLFCDDRVPEAEVGAFLRRSQKFPQLLFALVEPNRLPPEGKKQIAEWLASEDLEARSSSIGVILTAPWYIPCSAQVREIQVRPNQAVQIWREQCPVEVLLYHSEPPKGTGPSSGKSTYIRHSCKQNDEEIVSCILHEGFQLSDFIAESRRRLLECGMAGRRIAVHVDVTAYSDWQATSAFLRNLLLCQVLYDPASGQMASLPDGTRIHVEVGAVVGKRDLHSLKPYATEATMQARFPQQHESGMQLTLSLLYPSLEIVGKDASGEVTGFPLQEAERHYLSKLHGQHNQQVHAHITCDSCGAAPVRGACYTCQVRLVQSAFYPRKIRNATQPSGVPRLRLVLRLLRQQLPSA